MSRHERTFAEMVAEAKSQPLPERHVRPGLFNHLNEFFDHDGRQLQRVKDELAPGEARDLVAAGAELAWEGCGCGGFIGCQPTWVAPNEREALSGTTPRFVRGFGSPTWIDLWQSEGGAFVVFAHGDVTWGTVLS